MKSTLVTVIIRRITIRFDCDVTGYGGFCLLLKALKSRVDLGGVKFMIAGE